MKPEMDRRETFADSVRAPTSPRARLRQAARGGFLTLRGMALPDPGSRFLRCLYSHYVFDDQRREFQTLIRALCDIGAFVPTEAAVDMISGKTPIDGRYFHLSYDDGLGCLYRNAAPVLDAQGIPAIFFVNSAVAGETSDEARHAWDCATGYARPLSVMSWPELKELNMAGFEIGAHTRNHARLSTISQDHAHLKDEVRGCKKEIEAHLEQECRYISWPYGTVADVDVDSIREIREAGFEAAFGAYRMRISPGSTNPFMIPRHHFEPQWPLRHTLYFACGGMETPTHLPPW